MNTETQTTAATKEIRASTPDSHLDLIVQEENQISSCVQSSEEEEPSESCIGISSVDDATAAEIANASQYNTYTQEEEYEEEGAEDETEDTASEEDKEDEDDAADIEESSENNANESTIKDEDKKMTVLMPPSVAVSEKSWSQINEVKKNPELDNFSPSPILTNNLSTGSETVTVMAHKPVYLFGSKTEYKQIAENDRQECEAFTFKGIDENVTLLKQYSETAFSKGIFGLQLEKQTCKPSSTTTVYREPTIITTKQMEEQVLNVASANKQTTAPVRKCLVDQPTQPTVNVSVTSQNGGTLAELLQRQNQMQQRTLTVTTQERRFSKPAISQNQIIPSNIQEYSSGVTKRNCPFLAEQQYTTIRPAYTASMARSQASAMMMPASFDSKHWDANVHRPRSVKNVSKTKKCSCAC